MLAGSRSNEDGGLHGMTAMVNGVAGGGFTFGAVQGVSGMSLTAGGGTQFSGVNGLGGMANGMLVSFDAMRQSDGTWMATRVQARMPGGTMAGGVVTGVTGTPPTQLTLVVGDGAGQSMMRGNLAGTTTVNLADSTIYSVDEDDVDLTNLPFTPSFGRTSLAVGQRLLAFSGGTLAQGGGMRGMMGGGTISATRVVLAEQGLRGTVSGYAAGGGQASFALALAGDSAFRTLTGAATVAVYRQAGTQVVGAAPANGGDVQVRGLLFRDGANYRLVASRIRGL
jgi:hypothetical protein